jgi:hypothetical protein
LNSKWGFEDGGWGVGDRETRRLGDQETKRSGHHSPFVIRHSSFVISAVLLVFTLAACGSGISQTAQTERYTVALTLDSASFGERTATIAVDDRAGQPAAVDEVVLAPVMESMGMASPELVAQPTAPGRYQVKGDFFSMLGEWQVKVRISAAGKDDLAQFLFQVQ